MSNILQFNNDNVWSELKQKINCYEYATNYMGLTLKKTGKEYRTGSPFIPSNKGTNTSFVIWNGGNSWYDHKLQYGGTVIQLIREHLYPEDRPIKSYRRTLERAKKITGISDKRVENTSELDNYSNDLESQLNQWKHNLINDESVFKLIEDRGFPRDYIEKIGYGFDTDEKCIIRPFDHNGRQVYYYRWTPIQLYNTINPAENKDSEENFRQNSKPYSKYKKQKSNEWNKDFLMGFDTLERETPLIITEGLIDFESFYYLGYRCLLTGGTPSKAFLEDLVKVIRQYRIKEVILCFDQDYKDSETGEYSMYKGCFNQKTYKGGLNHTKMVGEALIEAGIPFKVGVFDSDCKDANDHFKKNGELQSVIDNAYNGLSLLSYIKSESLDSLEQFSYKLSRKYSTIQLDNMLDILDSKFNVDENTIKSLKNVIKKAPPDAIVANEILDEHDLVYFEGNDFYEFNSQVWKKVNDFIVKGYSDELLGDRFSTKTRNNSILDVTQTKAFKDGFEFDKKRLMSFQNGTLNLDTLEFNDFNKDDLITIQLDYDRNPEADCKLWKKFIEDVTGGVKSRQLLLQEAMGYVLFPDNSLQTSICLYGDGSNGKSVFLYILKRLFSEDNCSFIELSELKDHFRRIYLRNSLINISTENKPDSKGAETYFKKLVVGDPLDGCLKNENFVFFEPRAKLFMACNELTRFNEANDGIYRRLTYIPFNQKFKLDGKINYPEEHIGDASLSKKLVKELPGIFNWALEGYKRLVENGKFTIDEGGEKLKDEFKYLSDPMYNFIESGCLDETIKRGELCYQSIYPIYQCWMRENGFKPVASNRFARPFSRTFRELYPDWRPGKVLIYRYPNLYNRFDSRVDRVTDVDLTPSLLNANRSKFVGGLIRRDKETEE